MLLLLFLFLRMLFDNFFCLIQMFPYKRVFMDSSMSEIFQSERIESSMIYIYNNRFNLVNAESNYTFYEQRNPHHYY